MMTLRKKRSMKNAINCTVVGKSEKKSIAFVEFAVKF